MASRSSSSGARIRGGLILSIAVVWILTSFSAPPSDFVTVGAPAGRSSGSSLSMVTRGAFKKGQIEGLPLNKDSSNDRVARGALKKVQFPEFEGLPTPEFESLPTYDEDLFDDRVNKAAIAFSAVALYVIFQFVINGASWDWDASKSTITPASLVNAQSVAGVL
mmetsp:Transcript_109104/g.243660  ORF Transcript_109104/g.243660 Transcript_109104/m.243660 type:complete len:164 (-) Transcript_109104:97-588(-)